MRHSIHARKHAINAWPGSPASTGQLVRHPGSVRKINVRVPTFLYQVRHDVLTEPGDVQAMFDNIPVGDKELQWIYGTTRRWDGYLEFQRHPEPMLKWFAKHMS